MGRIRPNGLYSHSGLASSRSRPGGLASNAVVRLPTDPLYYSSVTIENIVVGSRYQLAISGGDVIETDVALSTSVTIDNVPGYVDTQLLRLVVRYSSSGVKYIPLTQFAQQTRNGASFYLSQVIDGVAV